MAMPLIQRYVIELYLGGSTKDSKSNGDMPTYEFECNKCGHKFNMLESISEHGKHKEKCPKCDAQDVKALVSAVNVKTSKKS